MPGLSWTRLLGLALGIPAAALGVLYARWFRRPLPRLNGRTTLRGLDTPAEVLWDRWGIPHAYARTQEDLFFLQGYLHALDRLWQMELGRRFGSGRLSELFGPRTLEADRFLRRVGLRRVAQRELEQLDPTAVPALTAYCRGVNAFLRTHRDRLPVEFSLLRFRPEPWTPVDSLLWAKVMGWSLSLNWDVELFRARFVAELGPEVAAGLEQLYPPGHPLTTPPGAAEKGEGRQGLEEWQTLAAFLSGGYSNAWVVAGARSQTGQPLLANDPHLIPQLPSVWYEIHLECPDFRITGVSLPGAPGVVIGHNERIAWGITASMVDTQDVYVEEFSSQQPRLYSYQGEWREAEVVREEIGVKGRKDSVVEEVLVTHHGPIIVAPKEDSRRALALRSAVLEPSQLVKAGLALARASDWRDFRAALDHWAAPAVNFVYADTAGNIGYQLAGRIPRRAPGTGLLPLAGWVADQEWQGYLPQEELPHAFNPAEQYIVNANNKVAADAESSSIQGEWIDGYRAQRIQDLLLSQERLSAADFQRMHLDVLSLPALELQRWVKGTKLRSPQARRALEAFLRWDGRVTVESAGAALYQAFRRRLLRNFLAPLLGPLTDDYFGMQLHPLGTTTAYQFRGASYLLGLLEGLARREKGGSQGPETDELISRSLEEALAELRKRLGKDERRWSWGRLHRVTFRHALGEGPVLGRLFNRGPYPLMGDPDTVHQAAYSLRHPYEATRWLPSYRFIADTADWDRCLSIHAPGQSGQPGSPHYDDLIPLWRRGEYHPMPFSREAVEEVTVTHQTFLPESG